MADYSYTHTEIHSTWVTGTVTRGKVRANTRKGQTFNAGGRRLLLNRVNGVMDSVTVLGSDGKAEARLAPDAKVW